MQQRKGGPEFHGLVSENINKLMALTPGLSPTIAAAMATAGARAGRAVTRAFDPCGYFHCCC